MENKENPMQPEPELTPDQQLDLLLEKFLAEEPETEEPVAPVVETPLMEEEPQISDALAAEEMIAEVQSTEQEDVSVEEVPTEEGSIDDLLTDMDMPLEETSAAEISIDDMLAEVEASIEATLAEEAIPEFTPNVEVPLTQEAIWEDQPVDIPVVYEEIGPDEQIIATAGLTHPEDLEFERIMEETLQENAEEEASEEDSTEAEDFSLPEEFFLPAENDPSDEEAAEDEPYYTEVDEAGLLLLQQQAEQMAQATQEEAAAEVQTNEEEQFNEEQPPRKRRPKNTGTYGFFGIPHMITTVIWLALIVFIGASLGGMIWNVAADMLAFGRPNQTVTITITSSDDLDSIAQKLQDTGLIEYPGIFKFYFQIAGKKVKPGTYELNTIYDYMALAKNMSGTADRVDTKVMIPEGYTCRQIFRLLEKSGVCTVEAMEEAVMNADLSKYWFLEGIDQSDPYCLEGYLFPDTYRFYLDHDPSGVLTKLLDTFDKRFTESMAEKLDALNENLADMMRSHGLSESYIQKNLFTIKEVVIVASMIEKETSGDEESYNIASVIYNRLTNPGGETAGFLQIDATLVYINGGNNPSNADKEIDSPYNTYLYKGLPAGAISNPGLASLNAALSPESTEYYFYALDPSTGSHKFFKTYKAHQKFLDSLKTGD